MWYELLPFMGLMAACTVAVQYIHIPFNYAKTGHLRNNKWPRHMQDAAIMGRDISLTGSPHKPLGLETIPDEE